MKFRDHLWGLSEICSVLKDMSKLHHFTQPPTPSKCEALCKQVQTSIQSNSLNFYKTKLLSLSKLRFLHVYRVSNQVSNLPFRPMKCLNSNTGFTFKQDSFRKFLGTNHNSLIIFMNFYSFWLEIPISFPEIESVNASCSSEVVGRASKACTGSWISGFHKVIC